VGLAFSIGQEARGAHFFSHDLSAAAIVWFLQLGLYAFYAGKPASNGR
jgi:membrane-associated PAP2 superfamily phosphatase